MDTFNLAALAVSPMLIGLLIVYLKRVFSVESFVNIRNAVILGMIAVVLLVIANYLIDLRWHDNLRNMRRMSFFVFIGIAFSSELAKCLVLRFAFFKLKVFEGPLEGILYAIFISLGFSTVASVLYLFGIVGTDFKFNDLTLYLYTYPLASIVFGIVMGFFVGMGKLRKNWQIDSATGLLAATFFHGLFYFGARGLCLFVLLHRSFNYTWWF